MDATCVEESGEVTFFYLLSSIKSRNERVCECDVEESKRYVKIVEWKIFNSQCQFSSMLSFEDFLCEIFFFLIFIKLSNPILFCVTWDVFFKSDSSSDVDIYIIYIRFLYWRISFWYFNFILISYSLAMSSRMYFSWFICDVFYILQFNFWHFIHHVHKFFISHSTYCICSSFNFIIKSLIFQLLSVISFKVNLFFMQLEMVVLWMCVRRRRMGD